MAKTRSVRDILLVEDDVIDAMTVMRTSKELGLKQNIIHVNNGQEALDYLNNNRYPDYILLDINMPIMNGVEFLEVKNKNEELSLIPTIVLTTSNAESDRLKCYMERISGYMIKPVDYSQFKELYKLIDNYWLTCESPIYKQ